MAFLIYNTTAGPIPIDDLGLEVPATSTYDLTSESPYDVAISVDLQVAISAGNITVLDPRIQNPIPATDQLSASLSQVVVDAHNDPLFGIRGALLTDLDNVDTTGAISGDVLHLNGSGQYVVVPPSTIGNSIKLGDLLDVADGIGSKPITSFYIFTGDGAGGTIINDATTDNTVFIPFIEDTVGGVFTGGVYGDITFTYNGATNKVDVAVDDSYLRNTGDTLDSGTLNIGPGASFVIATGATGTIVDAPINSDDITNKAYVDSVAQGTDNKDSTHVATTPTGGNIGGTYNPTGGTASTGAFTGITTTIIDGVDLSTHAIGSRLIVKDQTDAKQNGIYVITSITASPLSMDIERSLDMDGNPASEISPGNLAFVESGTINGNTSWIVTGTIDPIIPNTDPINWTQFSGSGSFTSGPGLGLDGTQFYLDVGNLTSITIDPLDEIAFNDVSDVALKNDKKRTFGAMIVDLGLFTDTNLTASDGVLITNGDIQLDITGLPALTAPTLNAEMVFDAGATGTHNKGTVADFFNGLDVVHGITANGIITRTANDTYASRTITASATAGEEGSVITNGDGVAGNPEVGVDIIGTTVSGNNMASTDHLLMHNSTNNVRVTGQQIANGVLSIVGPFNAYTTITGDTGTALATGQTDPLAFLNATNGGITTVASDGGPDTVTFAINADNLATGGGTVDLTDNLIVSEGAGAANTKKYTFQDMITDLNISTSGSLLGNDGVQVVGSTVSLDFVNMPAQGGIANALPIDINDIFAIDPLVSDVAGTHKKVTFNDMIRDLDIVYGLGGDGIAVQVASDTYVSRTLTVSTAAGEQGILLTDGDGIAGNPTWGFTITTLAGAAGNLLATDEVPVYDGTNNVKMTGQQVADGVASLLGGVGNAYTTITGDTGSATAANSSDTLSFVGAATGGITTSVTDATPDRVEFTIDFNQLAPRATPVTSAMLLGIGEGVASPTTTRSFANVLSDLGVPSGVGALTGLLVSNGAGVYTATSIAVGSGNAAGLNIVNATGVAGQPTVGLDIVGTTVAAEDITATDLFVGYNASGSVNNAFTGQEIANGVSTMIGLGGLAVSTINAQQVLTLVDTTRANKILSVSETEFVWAENRLTNNDWVSIGNARDARTGHVMPMNGTIVRVTAHTSNDNNNTKPIRLYIDGSLNGTIGTFTGVGGENQIIDATVDIDFIQGGKLRMRAGGGGPIEDTTISIFVKWRA